MAQPYTWTSSTDSSHSLLFAIQHTCTHSDPWLISETFVTPTGTAVGDPIEAKALGAVLGKDRPEDAPCLIDSVKANIGHLEAAAGIAGVIKAALCLRHAQIPPQANLQQLNPAIPFAELRLGVPR